MKIRTLIEFSGTLPEGTTKNNLDFFVWAKDRETGAPVLDTHIDVIYGEEALVFNDALPVNNMRFSE